MEAMNDSFYKDYWLFMKGHKDIEFDENGLSTDAYWEKLNRDAVDFINRLHPSKYAEELMCAFIKAMDSRAKKLEVQYRILLEQKQSFGKNSPEWNFYAKFVELSKKYKEPPVLLPDKSNESEVDSYWSELHGEAKAITSEYGMPSNGDALANNIIFSFLAEREQAFNEKAAAGIEGEQMSIEFSEIDF